MTDHLGEQLSLYLDGELGGEALVAAEAHLSTCASCQAALDALRRITRRARSFDDRPPERDLWAGIAARLGGGAEPRVIPLARRRRQLRLWRRVAACWAGAACVGLGLVALQRALVGRCDISATSRY
jgi:anti-sigma factor RsiW